MTAATEYLRKTWWQVEQRLPEAVQLALICQRRRPHWARAGVIFIHVPKAAGTAISHALYGRALGHVPATAVARHCPELWQRAESFAVLRGPVDRALSAWRFARTGGTEVAGISAEAQAAVAGFESFADFATGYLARTDLTRADPVFRPQAGYVCDGAGEVMVGHLFTLPALNRVETWLAATLGRPIEIGELNRSRGQPAQCDPQTAALVREIYGADQALLARLAEADP